MSPSGFGFLSLMWPSAFCPTVSLVSLAPLFLFRLHLLFPSMFLPVFSTHVYLIFSFECYILVSALLGFLSNQREMTHL